MADDCRHCGDPLGYVGMTLCDGCGREEEIERAVDVAIAGTTATIRVEEVEPLVALLRRALPIVNGDRHYDWPEWELLARDISAALKAQEARR